MVSSYLTTMVSYRTKNTMKKGFPVHIAYEHPSGYLHLFYEALLVTILSPKNVRFELRDPDLVQAWDNCDM
jgi:hypothetical protein